jgi:hypothetical protein
VSLFAAQSATGYLMLNSSITTHGGVINLFTGTTTASSTYANVAAHSGLAAVPGSFYGHYVSYSGGTLTSNGGDITIANSPNGVSSWNAIGASIQAGGGNIAIAGYATGSIANNMGVSPWRTDRSLRLETTAASPLAAHTPPALLQSTPP